MTSRTAVIVDLVLVAIFATIGRASHSESLTPAGVFDTAWPFLAAAVIGWAVLLATKRDGLSLRHGVLIWLVTVVGGLLIRVGSGDTAAWPFIVVATLVQGLFLLGWRLVLRLVRRRAQS